MSFKKAPISKIVAGGQTGVDRAALDTALKHGLECGGWCPRGRIAEDGIIPFEYPLRETPRPVYSERTEWNVRDSDGTLVLTKGKPTGGAALTIECARKQAKPVLVLDVKKNQDCGRDKFEKWLSAHRIEVLHVAGPRESHSPGEVYSESKTYLAELLGLKG